MAARVVPIAEVLVHESLGLCIVPNPPSQYQYIYRAARSARWSSESRMLYLVHIDGWTHLDVFRSIVNSVAEEYGDRLFVNGTTTWNAVPTSVRADIEALESGEVF
jgi:hypothetical protein